MTNSTERHELRKHLRNASITPCYQTDYITLYCGDMRQILPKISPPVDAVITDPPYGTTSLKWDAWPKKWPDLVAPLTNQLWCFGSMRLFLSRSGEFHQWRFAQDIVWEKQNGSGSANDRFRRVHEHALHFYRGEWRDLHKKVQYTNDATARTVRRKKRPPHWGDIGAGHYKSKDGGPRLMRSVLKVRNCHGYAVNETQKPEDIVRPLIEYSVPAGGVMLDCFAGSGTTLAVALKTGRRAIGIELRQSQCDIIIKRLEEINNESI